MQRKGRKKKGGEWRREEKKVKDYETWDKEGKLWEGKKGKEKVRRTEEI